MQVHIQLLTTAKHQKEFTERSYEVLCFKAVVDLDDWKFNSFRLWSQFKLKYMVDSVKKTPAMRQIFTCFSVWHLWRPDCCRFGCRGKDDGNVVERRCYLALERKQNVCVLSWTPHNSHRQTETEAWTHKTCLTLKNGHKADLDLNTTCKCEISLVHGISQVSIAIPKWQKQDMKFSSDKNSWTLKNARTIFSTTKNMTKYELCASMAFYIWFTRLNCIS